MSKLTLPVIEKKPSANHRNSSMSQQLIPRRVLRFLFYTWMGLLMATQVVGFVGQFAGAIRDLLRLPDRPFTSQIGTTFSVWLWASATADVSISVVCACSLRSRLAGYTCEADSLLHRLVVICFRTAAFTSFMAIIAAILSTIFHANFTLHLYVTFACVLDALRGRRSQI